MRELLSLSPNNKVMKKLFLILIITCLVMPIYATKAADKNPKLVNYFLHWSITESEARELAKWDLLILDMEVQENSPMEMRLIRQLNPNIKIIAYITSQNLFDSNFNSSEAVLREELRNGLDDSWWLRDDQGNKISDWPGTNDFNITNYCPSNANGQKFNDYLPEFVAKKIIGTGLWDGVFYDNIWNSASWLNGGNISLLDNGRKSQPSDIDESWKGGVKKILTKTRELVGPTVIIMGNGSFINDYQKYLNGWMLEDFPTPWENGGSWSGVVKSYLNLPTTHKFNVVNAATSNRDNYALMRYSLTSTLLGNAYFSFDYGPSDHAQLWRYDEYDVNLGPKQGVAYNLLDKNNKTIKAGLWRRDFQNGIALVNSTDKEQNYIFAKEDFERIKGEQDPKVNNGQKVNSVKLAAKDGLILLKSPNTIKNNWYINGNFFRVFNYDGAQTRNGFFAYNDSFTGSAPLFLHTLINGDEQVLSAVKGELLFYRDGQRIRSFKPYGDFKGIFSLTIADVLGDTNQEIITGAGLGGGPHVRVFDFNGKVKASFFAYDKNFRGGVNVAAGDVDGDGVSEIITGAGLGGGPQVRIFNSQGQAKLSFFAYDKNFRGGVNVAVGDVDGDGVSDIVTGAGPGGGPQVRIFDGQGIEKQSFMAYDKNYRKGISVSVYDLNGDGTPEILSGISGF